jgi:hypothetical protein
MRTMRASVVALVLFLGLFGRAHAVPLSGTGFADFTVGASVDGQDGWSVFIPGNCGVYDESVVDFNGNKVWRVSNAVTCGSFGDQPFAPRPGGSPTDSVNDPVNSDPLFFAGETSTGAAFNRFFGQFSFRSATGVPQPRLRITVSIDNGEGGRQSFIALRDSGSGIAIDTFDVDRNGGFIGPITIASGLSYTRWHTVKMQAHFKNGSNNDTVEYRVNGKLVHTGQSWEQFYRNFQAALHPHGVPVQTLLFRLSETAAPAVAGGGFYIDNVFTRNSNSDRDDEDRDDDDRDDKDRDDD